MEIAAQYAQALHEVVAHDASKAKEYLKNLHASLESRGHLKLLPKVFAEFEKLDLKLSRSEIHKKVTPEMKRTKVLLSLYEKLVH